METVRFRLRKRGAPWLRLVGIGLGIGFLVIPADNLGTKARIARAQGSDASYETEVQKGRESLRRHEYESALKSFKRANEMRNKLSPECFFGMAQAYNGLEAYKNVISSCDKTIEFAGSDIELQARAYNLKGIALQKQAGLKDQKKLQEAEAVFRQGLALGVDLPILRYNLGFTLMQQKRDPEGIVEVKKYLELEPGGSKAEEGAKLVVNPRRSREAYAPEFSITTSDGEYVALEDLQGKVVLLDFWGTWCPPCVESLPLLRDLHKKYSKEKSFVMIGISVRDDEEEWRAFTAKNQMVWMQYRDEDGRVQRAFEVDKFPTYIVIDHEGIVRFRTSGMSSEGTGEIEAAIRKQIKNLPKPAAH